MNSTKYDLIYLLGFAVFAGLAILIAPVRRWLLKYRSPDSRLTPLLLSYFTHGNDIVSSGKVELTEVKGTAIVNKMITVSRRTAEEDLKVPAGSVIIFVELPFRSKLHLLGIAKDEKLAQLDPTFGDSVMQKVELEGDFPDYFSLYADQGEQVQARYIVDPSAMAFVVDFCKNYHWEILDDGLCFVAKVGLPDNVIITEFIKQIRPALEVKKEPTKYMYKQKTFPCESPFKCPICLNTMIEHRYWHECSKGHGQLLRGGLLADMKEKRESFPKKANPTELPEQHLVVSCPSCKNKMEPIAYGGSKIIIDACIHCQYRWLDAGELKNILKGTDRV